MTESNQLGSLLYRPAKKEDWNFIRKSWIRSYAKSPYAGSVSRHRLTEAIHGTIEDLRKRQGFNVAILCFEQEPDTILGFVAYETAYNFPCLHYVYVKELFRGEKLGSSLIKFARGSKPGPMRYTFKTPACSRCLQEARFRPQLVRNPLTQNARRSDAKTRRDSETTG